MMNGKWPVQAPSEDALAARSGSTLSKRESNAPSYHAILTHAFRPCDSWNALPERGIETRLWVAQHFSAAIEPAL